MNRKFLRLTLFTLFALSFSVSLATTAAAQGRPYRVSERQVQTLLDRIETRTNTFRGQIDRNLDRRPIDGTRREDNINDMVGEFETATDTLRNNFASRDSTADDVQNVLNQAVPVDRFVRNNNVSRNAQTTWNLIRTDLNTLAGYYRVSANWGTGTGSGTGTGYGSGGSFDQRLTGTYRLNVGQSDNVAGVVDRALGNNDNDPYNDNTDNRGDRRRRNLERRLTSPDTLALEKRGRAVTMSSPSGSSIQLTADGVVRSETSQNGRTLRTRVTATSRDLTINHEGDRMNDYYVSFTPVGRDQLRVTRRLYIENRNETVTVNSVYDKTSPTAEWHTTTYPPTTTGGSVNDFIVPNNTGIIATLDTPLSTKTARDGDRFSMTVNSPSQYRGAIIEGNVVGERSGVVSGRANMSLSFDTIRLRNDPRPYRFAGIVDQVRKTNGDTISVNNEGAVRDSSQTTKTVKRAGLGAALGAILGAVIGGGQGAVIGAGVGAGAGAGTVVLQGRDNLELESGSEFTVTATAPANTAVR